MIQPGDVFDGCRIIRPIGSGGFGEVWLSQSEAEGDFRALKYVPAENSGRLEKEFDSVCRYRSAAKVLQSPSLIPIQHPSLHDFGMTYLMPLADGFGAAEPTDPRWRPLTLTALMELRKTEPTWFSSEEIREWLRPILDALQLLSNAGLVHRDVKPDNILFFNMVPCLADISLLGADSEQLTRRGTPGYVAPSWFVESNGHPDMYGAATTLYSMLTGNSPDKMGRATFRWPPQGEASLSSDERLEWLRFHRVIRRSIDDRPAERFLDFSAFARGLSRADQVGFSDFNGAIREAETSTPHPSTGLGRASARRRFLNRRAALLPVPMLSMGGNAASKKQAHHNASARAKPESPTLGSEIPWVSAAIVVDALKTCGFKQIVNESGLVVFNKKMKEEDIPQGVSIALHFEPTSNAVWTYRCLRVSNNETLKFDNKAFEEGITSICGIFVSDKEWSEIRHFIYQPKNAMKEVRFKSEAMTFRGAHLSADCELVFEADDTSTLQHAFALSSRE